METIDSNYDKNQSILQNKDVIRDMIDQKMKFTTISQNTGLSMQELLNFYKENYPKQYNEEIYTVMREENIYVFSEASEYLDQLAKLADEQKGKKR